MYMEALQGINMHKVEIFSNPHSSKIAVRMRYLAESLKLSKLNIHCK